MSTFGYIEFDFIIDSVSNDIEIGIAISKLDGGSKLYAMQLCEFLLLKKYKIDRW